jgi:hypothetical protein
VRERWELAANKKVDVSCMHAGRKQANRNAVAVALGPASTAAPAGVCATRVALPKAECLDRMSGPRKQAVALVVRFDSEYW